MRTVLPVAALWLGGCAALGPVEGYPDIGPRATETVDFLEPEPAPGGADAAALPPLPAPDAATLALLGRIERDAAAGERAFAAMRAQAERAVSAARGAAVGSEAWVVAHQAISRLDAARAPTRAALSSAEAALPPLDAIEQTPGAAERIARHRRAVEQVAAQSGVVAALVARLRRP